MKTRVILVVVFIVVCGAAAYGVRAIYRAAYVNIAQPIAFNHKLHMEGVGMKCSECHRYYQTQANSGPPVIAICMDCHKEALTASKEEAKLREFAGAGREIPWRRIYYVPDHVFFSHRMHAALSGIKCEQCHGGVQAQTAPPTRPLVPQTMEFCIACHKEMGASTECLACHR